MPGAGEILAAMALIALSVLLFDWWYLSSKRSRHRIEQYESERDARLQAAFRESLEKLRSPKPADE